MPKKLAEGEHYQKCLCGRSYVVKTWMLGLERKLCSTCYMRETKIMLHESKIAEFKKQRTYSELKLTELPEYSKTRKAMMS